MGRAPDRDRHGLRPSDGSGDAGSSACRLAEALDLLGG
jgi:hypothetical protein